MIYIEVCATSANVCVGFDVLGLALDLKNRFTFEEKKEFSFKGFDYPFNQKENNLIFKTYSLVFERAKKKPIPVEIGFEGSVPIARGLGSSATLIVAGLLAANSFLDHLFSKEELLQLGSEIEGHPDNIAPALFGGFVASFYTSDKIHSIQYPVSSDLKFFVIIPAYQVSTEQARGILPAKLEYQRIVSNLSRIIHLPKALKEGNLELLRELFHDQLHEPYRKNLIKEYDKVKQICDEEGLALAISGSGSTMLVIGKDEQFFNRLQIKDCQTMLLEIGKEAHIWKE